MGIIEWLTSYIGVILIFIVLVLTIIISWKVYFRERLLKSASEPEDVEKPLIVNKPNLIVFIRPHATCLQCLMLCIENIGTEAAHNVKFGTGNTPSLNTSSSNLGIVQSLKKNNILQNGITCFGPGQKIEQFLLILKEKLPEDMKQPMPISVTYTDSINNNYENRYPLDFNVYQSLMQINTTEDKADSVSYPIIQTMQTGFNQVVKSIESLKVPYTSKPNDGKPTSLETEKTLQPVRNDEEKPLSPDLQKLVNLYNQGNRAEIQNIYNATYSIRVTNETELYQNPNITPIFETNANGSFVVYSIDSKEIFAVVPFFGCILQNDLFNSGAFGKVFECPGFDPKYKYNIKVVRPALFKQDPVSEKWTIEKKGILELEKKIN